MNCYRSKLINSSIVHTIKVAFIFDQFLDILSPFIIDISIVSEAFKVNKVYVLEYDVRPSGVRIREVQLYVHCVHCLFGTSETRRFTWAVGKLACMIAAYVRKSYKELEISIWYDRPLICHSS